MPVVVVGVAQGHQDRSEISAKAEMEAQARPCQLYALYVFPMLSYWSIGSGSSMSCFMIMNE